MNGANSKSTTKKKKNNRLSLSTKKKLNTESPQTPKANVLTTDQSSPSEPLCSTPLNTRKRNCTPDDIEDSPVLMTFTQDLRRFGTDVTWQWNSPKRHIAGEKRVKEKPTTSRRVATVARPHDSPSPIRPSERLQRTTQLSGFYKFQKELQELELFSKKEEALASDTDTFETAKTSIDVDYTNQLNCSTNKGADTSAGFGAESPDVFADDSLNFPELNVKEPPPLLRVRTNLNKSFDDLSKADPTLDTSAMIKLNADDSFRKYKSSDNFSLKNQANDFFDYADFDVDDDLLNKCMEQAEVLSQKQAAATAPTKRSSLAATCETMFNDSMDDCFSQFPINEVIAKQQPTNVIGSPKPMGNTSFGRHNSSPQLAKPKPVFQHKQPSRSTTTLVMQRHMSMPVSTVTGISKLTNYAQPSPPSSEHSSIESLPSSISPRKCTAAEIEKKRQQAIQRRKAAMAKLKFAKGQKR